MAAMKILRNDRTTTAEATVKEKNDIFSKLNKIRKEFQIKKNS